MGDPAGVGPELCLRLLTNKEVCAVCTPLVFGDRDLLRRVGAAIGLESDFHVIEVGSLGHLSLERLDEVDRPTIAHVRSLDAASVEPGKMDANTGQGSFDFIEAAIAAAHAGRSD